MASLARQRLCASSFLVFVLVYLVAQAHGRFLIMQQSSVNGEPGELQVITDDPSVTTSSYTGDSIFTSPISWLQQQLAIVEELERVAFQRLMAPMALGGLESVESGSSDANGRLRNVGCARMRAALIDKMSRSRDAVDSTTVSYSASVSSDGSSSGSTATSAALAAADLGPERQSMASTAAAVVSTASTGQASDADSIGVGATNKDDFFYDKYSVMDEDGEDGDELYSYYSEEELEEMQEFADMYDDYMEYEDEEYEDEDEDDEDTFSSSTAKHIARQLGDDWSFSSPLYGDDGYGDDESARYEATVDSYLDELLGDFGPGGDEYEEEDEQEYEEVYDDYREMIQALADADGLLSQARLDPLQEVWEDYLDLAYEFYEYVPSGYESYEEYDEDDLYVEYYDDGYDPAGLRPEDMLAELAEMVAWAQFSASLQQQREHMFGNQVTEVHEMQELRSLGEGDAYVYAEDGVVVSSSSDGSGSEGGPMLMLIPGQPFADIAWAAVFNIPGFADEGQEQANSAASYEPVTVVNQFDLRLVYPDGSINWGLVTLCILAAGTAAMSVGFVLSCVSLRRSMRRGHWVFVPAGYQHQQWYGAGCKGKGWAAGLPGGELDKPLLLAAEECGGAIVVERAAEYVTPADVNESVAKALCK